ncbi:hypothetical protein [Hymenobacter terricola]|uniref:hypothetical protein n=1 Tax=Hymenobacter terricola TaxID=2819236 RepID=UPI001B314687|nr:hypothetical protein [Hymenobacter terricola]
MVRFLQDCHTATLHLEQARDNALPWPHRLRLWTHLVRCAYCRRYARQSRYLEDLARPPAAGAGVGLTREARARLQRRLQEAIDAG